MALVLCWPRVSSGSMNTSAPLNCSCTSAHASSFPWHGHRQSSPVFDIGAVDVRGDEAHVGVSTVAMAGLKGETEQVQGRTPKVYCTVSNCSVLINVTYTLPTVRTSLSSVEKDLSPNRAFAQLCPLSCLFSHLPPYCLQMGHTTCLQFHQKCCAFTSLRAFACAIPSFTSKLLFVLTSQLKNHFHKRVFITPSLGWASIPHRAS